MCCAVLSVPQGRVYAPGSVPDASADAVRSFNEALLSDSRVEVVHVPFRDGVGLVRRRWGGPRGLCTRGWVLVPTLTALNLAGWLHRTVCLGSMLPASVSVHEQSDWQVAKLHKRQHAPLCVCVCAFEQDPPCCQRCC